MKPKYFIVRIGSPFDEPIFKVVESNYISTKWNKIVLGAMNEYLAKKIAEYLNVTNATSEKPAISIGNESCIYE